MRRTTFAIALLLATAPVARAETPVPTVQPDLQVVQTAAPSVRQDPVKSAVVETRKATTLATQRMNTTTIVILVLAAIGALVVLSQVF